MGVAGTALIVNLLAFSTPRQSNIASTTGINESSNHRSFGNDFIFVPYGDSAPTDHNKKMISCDGKVPGTHLDLTHWTDNTTPEELYADTSTEIALNFASARLSSSPEQYIEYDDALVLNNHFDTDGVLSIWTCLHPTLALKYRDLLISAAEAGDFGEWSSDEGVMLDCALETILNESDDEASAYSHALESVSSLLADLEDHRNDPALNGSKNAELWKHGFEEAIDDWDDVKSGRVVVSKAKAGRLAFVMDDKGTGDKVRRRLGPYALHRALREIGLAGGQPGAATRVLRARLVDENGSRKRWKYEYEMPGHGWVKRLVSRETVPHVDTGVLSSNLNEEFPESKWVSGGPGGLVSICRTVEATDIQPETVLDVLLDLDAGL